MPALGHESTVVEVVGQYDPAVGAGDTASQGVIGADQLGLRALQRPADLLESIPGMVVTQHSGDGKANQYFLRGMNLDHGTDFATTVNGVPVNLPSHAHGQGYSDLNFLIPELVRRVDYRKGPYFASEGDFSSAGSAHFVYRTRLDQPFADLTLGQRGHARVLVAGSTPAGEEATLLMAAERVNNNGPWTVPDGFRKSNAQFILSGGSPREGWTASLSSYAAHWRSTDQVPQRLIDAGTYQGQPFGRFDSLDPSDGASTRRTSLSGSGHLASDDELTQWDWYVLQYSLRLFSNFTYSLERASDQFAQTDNRTVLGGKASRSWFSQLNAQQSLRNTVGIQLRQDRIRAGLYDSTERQIQATVRDDSVRQTQAGVYAENEMGWTSWLRTVAGVRADQFSARVISHAQADNSGQSNAFLLSPKFSLVLGPWHQTAFFFNAGRGFHSNDARGTTARVDPRTGLPVDAVAALVGSRGRELGLKSQPHADWQTSLAFWQLDLDSELVYVGDAGNTFAGRPSRRTGVEWRSQWTPGRHFSMDLGLAWTRPRYTDGDPAGPYIVNAMQKVAHLALSLRHLGPWSASLGIRYLGAAPLTEDNAVRSSAIATANLRMQRKVSSDLDLGLDVLNLGNRKYNDIGYVYASRLAGEPAGGVEDLHVHPGLPRTVRVTARLRF
jgi:outer membrane cobalamin receptor